MKRKDGETKAPTRTMTGPAIVTDAEVEAAFQLYCDGPLAGEFGELPWIRRMLQGFLDGRLA